MSKRNQVARTESPTPEVDAEQNAQIEREAIAQSEVQQSEVERVATEADAKPMHSNLAVSQFKFKKTKVVALPLFKLVPDEEVYFLVDDAMYVGKSIDDKKEPAILMHVTDLETGEQGQIIIGKVLKDLISENYEDDSYVGKKFALTLRKRADKKYNTYDFAEIETEE
jgi:hypothetical protein